MVYGYAIDAESNSICATITSTNQAAIKLFETTGFENTQRPFTTLKVKR